MRKFAYAALVTGLALSLGACGSKSGKSSATDNLPSISDTEYVSDAQNLNSTESGLSAVGLKFKSTFDYNNGVAKNTYTWDADYLKEKGVSSPAEIVSALRNYIAVAQKHVAKYSKAFNLKKSDGSTEGKQLSDSVKSESNTKIGLAQQTIDKLTDIK